MEQTAFVAFEPREDGFVASVPMGQLDSLGNHPESVLMAASIVYGRSVRAMRTILDDLDGLKAKRTPIPAQKIWEFGDAVFRLVDELRNSSLELDGLYEHLMRDLGIDNGRLGKYRMTRAVTFRRHLPAKELIPESLRWRECEKNARGMAERLAAKNQEPAVA